MRFVYCALWNTTVRDFFTPGKRGWIIAFVGLRSPEQPGWTRNWRARTTQ
jgi:hypothetical protein